MTKINVVKKRVLNLSTITWMGFTLFVMIIIVLRQNQVFFDSKPHDSFIISTTHAISHHDNHGGFSKSIISCNRSHYFYDICSINGPTIFDPIKSTFYEMDSTNENTTSVIVEKIKPYPRKWENFTMGPIKEFILTKGPIISPNCMIQHKAQALVFSVGGYTGNFFHDINDGFLPLFITVNSLFPNNQDFIMVISKVQDWWVHKYKDLLQSFSKHPIIDIDDKEMINVTHCFPKVTLGLISHGFMNIDPKLTPNSKTLIDFHQFLATTYDVGKPQPHTHPHPQPQPHTHSQPQLDSQSQDHPQPQLDQLQSQHKPQHQHQHQPQIDFQSQDYSQSQPQPDQLQSKHQPQHQHQSQDHPQPQLDQLQSKHQHQSQDHPQLDQLQPQSQPQPQHQFQPQSQPQSQHQPQPTQRRPRLVLASRAGSIGRLILNQEKVQSMAEQIGFEVILFKPSQNTSLQESFRLIHSSHAMIGVHGAALTHALFLRPNSIFIQIVPIGAELVSDICFGKLARDMKLVYKEYKIRVEESSLIENFEKENSLVLKNPKALQEKGWSKEIMDIYLRQQNINLDLNRFRIYLEKAYQKAKIFIDING